MRPLKITLVVIFFQFTSSIALAVPTEGHKMVIAAPMPIAAEVGKKIAQQGGNVADVAVAIGLTLAVTGPYYAALGGGGFAMIKMKNQNATAIDFRETAPGKANSDLYKNKVASASTLGPLAVGIPGFPAGLKSIHKKYGKLKWKKLFVEPLKLATKGYNVSGEWARTTEAKMGMFNAAGLKYFFKNKRALRPGETLKQPQLAKALRLFRDRGSKAFYNGPIAKDIVDTLKPMGGILELDDFKNYKVRWLTPMKAKFYGHEVNMMPPPSSSGVVTTIALKLLEQLDVRKYPALSAEEFHRIAEILKISFRPRALLGDPDYYKNPIQKILDKGNIKTLGKKIRNGRVLSLKPIETFPKESLETTHFTVMDNKGNAIALTVTLNGYYGSKMVSNKYGIALNNEMDDFTTRPGVPNMFGLMQGKGNVVEAGKRPLSSMSPTIVTKNGSPVLALGAAGGPMIITSVLQTMYRVIARDLDIDKATNSPRVHHQFLPNTLFYDSHGHSPDTLKILKKYGHNLKKRGWLGRINGVRINKEGNLEAAFDARAEGGAAGL